MHSPSPGQAQRRFAASASHELRTPLTVIRSEVEAALADPAASAGELREMAGHVLEATRRMQRLLESLLVLARAGQAPLRREPVDLSAAARTAVAQVASELEGIDLELSLSAAWTQGDAPLVERLVGNLVENAVRHNEPAGAVWIRTGVEDGRPVLRVANSGPRVPPDDVPRLCEPFERLEPGGAGLGLAIARAVADAHGAQLALRARDEGGLEAEVRF